MIKFPAVRVLISRLALVVVLAAATTTCSGDESAALPNIPDTAAIIGPSGGRVESRGASIDVPAGALAEEVEITVGNAAEAADIEGYVTIGPTVAIGPTGTQFAEPATVTVPVVSGRLPQGRTMDEVVLYTADSVGEAYRALPSTVDTTTGSVSAQVDHLSLFAPVVHAATQNNCMSGGCDCDTFYDDLPLEVLGTASAGNPIKMVCFDGTELVVLSHTPITDPNQSIPDHYYISRYSRDALVQTQGAQETELSSIEGDRCASNNERTPTMSGGDAETGIEWSARVTRRTAAGDQRWYEELVYVSDGSSDLVFSLNRVFNPENALVDVSNLNGNGFDPSELVGHVLPSGALRLYFHNWYESHIDWIQLDDPIAMLSDPTAYEDPVNEGFHVPDVIDRIDLFDSHSYGSDPPILVVNSESDDSDGDIVVAFTIPAWDLADAILGHRVDVESGVPDVSALPPLPIDDFWHQLGWFIAGPADTDELWLGAKASSFDGNVMALLDTKTFTLVNHWELPCVGDGTDMFQVVPGRDGLVVWAHSGLFESDLDSPRLVFLLDGEVIAIGPVPFSGSYPYIAMFDEDRLLLINKMNGTMTIVAVPQ